MSFSLENHEKRLNKLEKKEEHIEGRFHRLHTRIDENEKKADEQTKKIFDSLDEIKKGQHSQELINQKMDFTLESINRERENEKESKKEQRKDFKKLKYLLFSMTGTFFVTLLISLVRSWFGF